MRVGTGKGWWRAQGALADAAFPCALLVVTYLTLSSRVPWDWGRAELRVLGFSVVVAAPLVWRRRWPRGVFAVVAVASFGQWLAGVQFMWANLAVLVALYTIAAEGVFRWGIAAALVTEAGGALEVWQQWAGSDWKAKRNVLLAFSVVACGVWILGIYTRTRREYLRGLEEKAARLERERDNQVRLAMTAERARIARELHDVVAHNVSVIVVQADGAGFAIDSDPERAKRALETISTTGRQALTEMRRLLGVLRDGGAPAAEPYAPQPGLEQLVELVAQVRESGLPVGLSVTGTPHPLPIGLQLALYRIVQEALTNTLKHAGPGATADVALGYAETQVRVTVRDTGLGARAAGDGHGHGLVGMRERAAMYGGTVRAGPCGDGGFEVTAALPLREGVRT